MSPTLLHPTKKEPETLINSEEQILLFESKRSSDRDFMIISLALSTGLRNGELTELTIECVRTFEVITSVLMLPGSIAKGGCPREIPLNADTRSNLKAFLFWKNLNGEDCNGADYLFVSKFSHNKLSPRDIQRIISNISKIAIGRSIHPHVLRHTFATRLLAVSNLRIVQKVLGHKNIQTTQIYTHPSNDEIAEAIDLL